MTELTFQYPDSKTEIQCERAINNIRQAARAMLHGIITIGQELIDVKDILDYARFTEWIEVHFDWSHSTAANYMNAARAVEEYPQGWEYPQAVLYLLTAQLPQDVKDEIMLSPVTLDEAKGIIHVHKASDWKSAVEDAIQTDPGAALFEIQRALDTDLRDAAAELMRKYAEKFALLSAREPRELLIESGLTLDEQYPGNPKVRATLNRIVLNRCVAVWVHGDAHTIVSFPDQADPVATAAQNAAIRAVCRELHID